MNLQTNRTEQPNTLPPINLDGDTPFFSEDRTTQLVWLFLLLGIVARSVRYFLRFPLWGDETYLCFNFIEKDYAALMQPLDYHQVAPILFLWAERAMTQLFGFNEMALRIIPFVCSITSLFLFRYIASFFLKGTALILSMAVFAVSYPNIRYAAEAKPYGTDLFMGIVLFALAVAWYKNNANNKYLWWMVLLTPLAVGYSYPFVFVAGGVSLAIFMVLWKQGKPSSWVAWCLYNVVLLGSFAVIYQVAKVQTGAEQGFMASFWQRTFPPWQEPLRLPWWFLLAHTSDLLAYPVGGPRGASTLTGISFAIGAIAAYRYRRSFLLLLCLVPLGLNLTAAAMHRYPYGGHFKFSQYIAPMICIVAGLGGAVFFNWLKKIISQPQKAISAWLIVLAFIAFASIARDFANPQKSDATRLYRDFARSFWTSMELEGEAACLYFDFNKRFSKETYTELNWAASHHCNYHIYSPRRNSGKQVNWDLISDEHPLRCVLYVKTPTLTIDFKTKKPKYKCKDFDQVAFESWLAEMQQKYRLVSRDRFPLPIHAKRRNKLLTVDYITVFKFVPK